MKGVIFDLDGTMVDNMMVHHKAWQNKLSSLGMKMSLTEIKEKVHGINEEILERLFGDRFTPEERKQISLEKEAEYRRIFADQLVLIKGLARLLEELKEMKIPMAVATAAPPENTYFVIDNLSLGNYFSSVIHAGQVSKGKPNPEVFIKAAKGLGLGPEECLVFEDSPTGAETAQRAGCKTIIITTTHTPGEFQKFPNVIQCIEDYTEITGDLLRKRWNKSKDWQKTKQNEIHLLT